MKAKILELMQREGLKPGQLAELLDISPAIISHILSERNKPSLDLLCKILRRFPQINPDWLLLDDPNMYRKTTPAGIAPTVDPSQEAGATEWSSGNMAAAIGKNAQAGSGAANAARGNATLGTGGFHGGLFDITGATTAAPEGAAPAGLGTNTAMRSGDAQGPQVTGSAKGAAIGNGSLPILRVVICYADGTFEDYRPTMR